MNQNLYVFRCNSLILCSQSLAKEPKSSGSFGEMNLVPAFLAVYSGQDSTQRGLPEEVHVA